MLAYCLFTLITPIISPHLDCLQLRNRLSGVSSQREPFILRLCQSCGYLLLPSAVLQADLG
jgi:hypothetical protein